MYTNQRKDQQRFNTMSYFIDASVEIVKEEGLSNLSIRKVSERAGFNSSSLYHYFSSFDELRLFACMKFVDEYAKDLSKSILNIEKPLDEYFKSWEIFCMHSFSHPEEFYFLFFKNKLEPTITHYFEVYYQIYPKDWTDEMGKFEKMFLSDSLFERENILLSRSLEKEGRKISKDSIQKINDMNILIYRGMLSLFSETPDIMPATAATEKVIEYIKKILLAFEVYEK